MNPVEWHLDKYLLMVGAKNVKYALFKIVFNIEIFDIEAEQKEITKDPYEIPRFVDRYKYELVLS